MKMAVLTFYDADRLCVLPPEGTQQYVSFMMNTPWGDTLLLLRLPSASYHSQNKPAQPLLLLFCGLTNPLVSTDSIRLHFTPCTSVTCHVSRPVLSGLFYWCGISQMIFLFCPNSAMVNKGWNLGCGPWVHMVWPLVTLVLFSHWPSTSVGPATDGASWCSCLRH